MRELRKFDMVDIANLLEPKGGVSNYGSTSAMTGCAVLALACLAFNRAMDQAECATPPPAPEAGDG